ncbi:MAG: hypothetical protein HY319_26950 [Armatimonadetes bacterium]|nr:hypothetical protein [Armatimonadota bacterium]
MARYCKLLWIWLLLAGVAASAAPAGLVTDLSGAAKRSGKPLSIMDRVEVGDEIRLGKGAHATLAFTGKGTRVELLGPVAIVVESTGVRLIEGAAESVTVKNPDRRASVALVDGVNLSKGAFLDRPLPRLQLLNGQLVAETTPTLVWMARGRFDSINVKIVERESYRPVLEVPLPGTARSYSVPAETPLAHGGEYEVELTGILQHRPHTDTWLLTVLPNLAAEEVHRSERYYRERLKADPTDVASITALLAVYLEHRLYWPALEMAEKAVQLRPSDPNLLEIRKNLKKDTSGGEASPASDG